MLNIIADIYLITLQLYAKFKICIHEYIIKHLPYNSFVYLYLNCFIYES